MSNTPPEASLYDRFQTFVLGALGFAAFGLLLVVLLFFRGCFAGGDEGASAEAAARKAKLDIVRAEQAQELEKLGLQGGDLGAAMGTALEGVTARPKGAKTEVLVPGSETALAQLQSAPSEDAEASAETEEKTDK